MDRFKASSIPLILLIALGLLSPAAALKFKVDINDVTDHGFYNLNTYTKSSGLHQINGTVENFGSIGCNYRIRAEFNRSGEIDRVWSPPKPIWPGDAASLRVDYLPENYTGTVDTDLYLEYCGLESNITSYSFESMERRPAEGKVDAEVESSNSSASRLRLGIEEGYMVPVDSPGGWKLSSARIGGSTSTVEYDAPIFRSESDLTYLVLDSSGELVGKTTFDLKPDRGIEDFLREKALEIALVLSILVNIVLASRIPRFRQKLKL